MRRDLATFDLLFVQSKNFQQGHGLLRRLLSGKVLQYRLGLAVLRDDERLSVLLELAEYIRSIRSQIADRFNLG